MNNEFIKLYDGSYIRKDSIISITSIMDHSFPRYITSFEFKINLNNNENRTISFDYDFKNESIILDKITEIRNDILTKLNLL